MIPVRRCLTQMTIMNLTGNFLAHQRLSSKVNRREARCCRSLGRLQGQSNRRDTIKPGSDPGSWDYSPEWMGEYFPRHAMQLWGRSIRLTHRPAEANIEKFCRAGTQGGGWGHNAGEIAFEQDSGDILYNGMVSRSHAVVEPHKSAHQQHANTHLAGIMVFCSFKLLVCETDLQTANANLAHLRFLVASLRAKTAKCRQKPRTIPFQ